MRPCIVDEDKGKLRDPFFLNTVYIVRLLEVPHFGVKRCTYVPVRGKYVLLAVVKCRSSFVMIDELLFVTCVR